MILSLGSKSFNRVEELSLSPPLPDSIYPMVALGGRSPKSTPFKNVKTATLLIRRPRTAPGLQGSRDGFVLLVVERFLTFNPALKSLRIVVCDEELRLRVASVLEGKYGGSGRFDSLVVKAGRHVLFDNTSLRVLWPGDPVGEDVELKDIL